MWGNFRVILMAIIVLFFIISFFFFFKQKAAYEIGARLGGREMFIRERPGQKGKTLSLIKKKKKKEKKRGSNRKKKRKRCFWKFF